VNIKNISVGVIIALAISLAGNKTKKALPNIIDSHRVLKPSDTIISVISTALIILTSNLDSNL
jgi:hypothetical protein